MITTRFSPVVNPDFSSAIYLADIKPSRYAVWRCRPIGHDPV